MRYAVLAWLLAGLTAVLGVQAPATAGLTARPATTQPGRDPGCCPTTRPSHVSISIQPLGDSITRGDGSTTGLGYRGPLDTLLPAGHRFTGAAGTDPWRHDGYSGAPIADLMTVPTRQGVTVLLHAGTNDAGRYFNHSSAQMLEDMGALLDRLVAGGARFVLVAQIVPTPVNTDLQRAQVVQFNAGLPGLAATRPRVRVVDMSAGITLVDGIHPDDGGYAEMARRWYAALRAAGAM